jgi:hypothetical protein
MKIARNFDARKIASAKNKTLFAMAFVCMVAGLFWSPSLREFAVKHPGIIGVLVAVTGEVYFDWIEEIGKHARWKKFFMALLVVSLSYELYEASETDKEAANAIKLAGNANERAANTESNNLVLRSNVSLLEKEAVELKLDVMPREFKDQDNAASRLRKFAGTKVAVITRSQEAECRDFVGQIKWVVFGANWDLLTAPGERLPTVVSVGTVRGQIATKDPVLPEFKYLESLADDGVHVFLDLRNVEQHLACGALVSELIKSGIDAKETWGLPEQPKDVALVVVSRKPDRFSRSTWKKIIEAEQMMYGQLLRASTNGVLRRSQKQ